MSRRHRHGAPVRLLLSRNGICPGYARQGFAWPLAAEGPRQAVVDCGLPQICAPRALALSRVTPGSWPPAKFALARNPAARKAFPYRAALGREARSGLPLYQV